MKVVLSTIVVAILLGMSSISAKEVDRYEQKLREERARGAPSCEGLVKQIDLCQRLREARERAKDIELSLIRLVEMVKRGKTVVPRERVTRPFGVVAYDETGKRHEILLGMPLRGTATFQPVVLTAHDPPYQVTRLRGTSYLKMVLDISVGGRPLYAYAANHLFFSEVAPSRRGEQGTILYLSPPPHLANGELASLGVRHFLDVAKEIREDLRAKGVMSKAYPGRLVADVHPEEVLYGFVGAEQTDPCLLSRGDPACPKQRQQLFESDAQTVDAVWGSFAVNGLIAYRDICSDMAACGTFQITNTKTRNYIGTYNVVHRAYPLADLDPDFKRGAMGVHNAGKAAFLLADYLLSVPATPASVRELFLEDYRLGFLYQAVGYNGGESQIPVLQRLLENFSKEQGIAKMTFETFPWGQFFAWAKGQKRGLKRETFGYLQKAVENWHHWERYTTVPEVTAERPEAEVEPMPAEEEGPSPVSASDSQGINY